MQKDIGLSPQTDFAAECLGLVGQNMTLDYGIALQYGDTEAWILSYFAFMTASGKKEQKYFREGRYWITISVAKLQGRYRFLTYNKIRTALARLEAQQVLFVNNFNTCPGDKTKWYTLNESIPIIKAYVQLFRDNYGNHYNNQAIKKAASKNALLKTQRDKVSLCENNKGVCEIPQDLSENHQTVCENHTAMDNTNNTNNNKYNNNTQNLSSPKKRAVKRGLSTILRFEDEEDAC